MCLLHYVTQESRTNVLLPLTKAHLQGEGERNWCIMKVESLQSKKKKENICLAAGARPRTSALSPHTGQQEPPLTGQFFKSLPRKHGHVPA